MVVVEVLFTPPETAVRDLWAWGGVVLYHWSIPCWRADVTIIHGKRLSRRGCLGASGRPKSTNRITGSTGGHRNRCEPNLARGRNALVLSKQLKRREERQERAHFVGGNVVAAPFNLAEAKTEKTEEQGENRG